MRNWLGIVVLSASAACAAHVSAVRPLPPEKEAEINAIASGRLAMVTLRGTPGAVTVKDARLEGSDVRFLQLTGMLWSASWKATDAPIGELQQIVLRDHGRGAWHGLAIGAGIGLVAGAVAGALATSLCVSDCAALFVGLGAAVGTVGFGLLGAGLGAAIGAPRVIEFKDVPTL